MHPYNMPPVDPRDNEHSGRRLGAILVIAWFTFMIIAIAVAAVLATRHSIGPDTVAGNCERTAPPWSSAECAARK